MGPLKNVATQCGDFLLKSKNAGIWQDEISRRNLAGISLGNRHMVRHFSIKNQMLPNESGKYMTRGIYFW
jgi:hypothetical protein